MSLPVALVISEWLESQNSPGQLDNENKFSNIKEHFGNIPREDSNPKPIEKQAHNQKKNNQGKRYFRDRPSADDSARTNSCTSSNPSRNSSKPKGQKRHSNLYKFTEESSNFMDAPDLEDSAMYQIDDEEVEKMDLHLEGFSKGAPNGSKPSFPEGWIHFQRNGPHNLQEKNLKSLLFPNDTKYTSSPQPSRNNTKLEDPKEQKPNKNDEEVPKTHQKDLKGFNSPLNLYPTSLLDDIEKTNSTLKKITHGYALDTILPFDYFKEGSFEQELVIHKTLHSCRMAFLRAMQEEKKGEVVAAIPKPVLTSEQLERALTSKLSVFAEPFTFKPKMAAREAEAKPKMNAAEYLEFLWTFEQNVIMNVEKVIK